MIELNKDLDGKLLPIKNKNDKQVCSPKELIFFFKNCFNPKERKFKMILLAQLGCECRIHEACAINLRDFHKGSNYRTLDMKIQKKFRTTTLEDGSKKRVGKNVIEVKYIPESIAAYLRAWIKDNWTWILQSEGFIFPSSHMEKVMIYTNPKTMTNFMSSKRKLLTKMFPDKGFDKETREIVETCKILSQKTKQSILSCLNYFLFLTSGRFRSWDFLCVLFIHSF